MNYTLLLGIRTQAGENLHARTHASSSIQNATTNSGTKHTPMSQINIGKCIFISSLTFGIFNFIVFKLIDTIAFNSATYIQCSYFY